MAMHIRKKHHGLIVLILALTACGFSCLAGSKSGNRPVPILEIAPFPAGDARDLSGMPVPVNANLPSVIETVGGQPVFQYRPGRSLSHATPEGYRKEEGTLIVSMRLPDDFDPESRTRRFLYSESADRSAFPFSLSLLHQGLRFDYGGDPSNYGVTRRPLDWLPGSWHTVAVTWKREAGFSFWLDGHPDSAPRMGSGKMSYMWSRWRPQGRPERIVVGALDESGRNAWQGEIGFLRIYGRVLSPEEILGQARGPVSAIPDIRFVNTIVEQATPGIVPVILHLGGDAPGEGKLRWSLTDASGAKAERGEIERLSLEPGKKNVVKLPIPALRDRTGTLRVDWEASDGQTCFREETLAAPPAIRSEDEKSKMSRRQVFRWNAAEPGETPHYGPLRRLETPMGTWLEAGPDVRDRFHVPFRVEHTDRRHLAVIRYPDDRKRSIEITLLDRREKTDAQLHAGIFTGWEYPNTRRMQVVELDFVPRNHDLGLIFMTVEKDGPAAVAEIEVFEVEGRDAFPVTRDYVGVEGGRLIGQYYEDPEIPDTFGLRAKGPDGSPSVFFEGANRLFDYMQATGMNLLSYPVAWYYGPLYESGVEPVKIDVNRPHPPHFPRYLMRGLERFGGRFMAGFHLHALSSLREHSVRDVAAIHAGEETIHNVQADGVVLIDNVAEHRQPSLYNPLAPELQEAVLALVREFVEDYGDEPALTGIHLRLARHALFWFGSDDSGYNDSNIEAFERDTGLRLPPAPAGRARFAVRHAWLRNNAWEAWVSWRCRQVSVFWKRIADVLGERRSDLRIYVDAGEFAFPFAYDPEAALRSMREAGFDPALFSDDARFVCGPQLYPSDYRFLRRSESLGDRLTAWAARPSAKSRGGIGLNADARANLLLPAPVGPWRGLPLNWVNFHERYFEDDVGRLTPLAPVGSEDPGDVPWRISLMTAPRFHALEGEVAAMANLDPALMIRGGIRLAAKGYEAWATDFALAYRALPAVRMQDVPGLNDPVMARRHDGKSGPGFYLLNRLPFPVTGELIVREPEKLRDAVTGRSPEFTGGRIELAPYALRTFTSTEIVGGAFAPADDGRVWLERMVRQLRSSPFTGEAREEAAKALQAAETGRWAEFYLSLQQSWRWSALKEEDDRDGFILRSTPAQTFPDFLRSGDL